MNKTSPRHLALLAAILVSPSLAFAGEAKPEAAPVEAGKALMALYMQTCMQHAESLDTLAENLVAKNVKPVPPDRANLFLPKGRGQAWMIPTAAGMFVISIPDTKRCAVHSDTAEADAAKKAFDFVLDTTKKAGVVISKTKDEKATSPIDGRVHVLGYTARNGVEKRHFELGLTTADKPASKIKATATLAVIE